MKKRYFGFYFLLLVFWSLFFSCKKDSFITSPNALLYTSIDSVKFDTVFTTTGSVTQSFKIFNSNAQKLMISKIKLMGGNSSAFKININGQPTAEVDNYEIHANDSMYVFVSVTINPTAANLPFIVSDSILINYNGNNKYVQLQAYGQNAIFLTNKVIQTNTTWANNLPYVILGSIKIDTTATLTINAGTKIYSHANAPFLVDGTLLINGTKNNEVVFAGDRLDYNYVNIPASWPGIYFSSNSVNNKLTYSILKNAYQAIVVSAPSLNNNPKLLMQQCIIANAYDAGIICYNTSLQINNSLISNCGSNVKLILGGNYNFTNCTVAAYSNNYIYHKNPVLSISNFDTSAGTTFIATLNATFINNIFWGDTGFVKNNIAVNQQGTGNFNVTFQNNLYRNSTALANCTLLNNIANKDPQFDSVDVIHNFYNFRIANKNAPAINNGILTTFTKDLDNNNRNNGLPDLGCYEYK